MMAIKMIILKLYSKFKTTAELGYNDKDVENDIIRITFRTIFVQLMNDKTMRASKNTLTYKGLTKFEATDGNEKLTS